MERLREQGETFGPADAFTDAGSRAQGAIWPGGTAIAQGAHRRGVVPLFVLLWAVLLWAWELSAHGGPPDPTFSRHFLKQGPQLWILALRGEPGAEFLGDCKEAFEFLSGMVRVWEAEGGGKAWDCWHGDARGLSKGEEFEHVVSGKGFTGELAKDERGMADQRRLGDERGSIIKADFLGFLSGSLLPPEPIGCDNDCGRGGHDEGALLARCAGMGLCYVGVAAGEDDGRRRCVQLYGFGLEEKGL